MLQKFRIGLFTSAWDEAAWQLVSAVHDGVRNGFMPNAEISFVFVSRKRNETAFGDLLIDNVRTAKLPLITFSSAQFKPELRKENREAWRLEHDREIMKLLPPTDLIILLGYMWWFGEEMCQEKIAINLHPALPDGPKGTYREVIAQLIREGAKETGVMMHLVTPELDRGPLVSFCRFPIDESDFDSIRQKGVARELPMVRRTLSILAKNKGQVLEGGYDLTEEINADISGEPKRRKNDKE